MENIFSHLLPILLLTILCLYSKYYTFVGAVDQRLQNCSVPRSCGSQEISFPFYIEEDYNYCGYPGFHLSCDYNNGDPRTILKLDGDDYIIHTIFYQNKSLIVSNAAFSTPNTACFAPLQKLSLPNNFFLTPNQSQVFLLQNCHNTSSELLKYKIGCSAENDTNWVLAMPENDTNRVAKASEKCGAGSRTVDLPMMKYSSETEGMKEVLSRGFMLSWIASDCNFCNSTGGKCGFDYSSYRFKCYCSDRPHRAHCDPPTGQYLSPLLVKSTLVIIFDHLLMISFFLFEKNNKKEFIFGPAGQVFLNISIDVCLSLYLLRRFEPKRFLLIYFLSLNFSPFHPFFYFYPEIYFIFRFDYFYLKTHCFLHFDPD